MTGHNEVVVNALLRTSLDNKPIASQSLFTVCTLVKISNIGIQTSSLLTLPAPASSSVCKLFPYYPHKVGCLVMRIKQMIIHMYTAIHLI